MIVQIREAKILRTGSDGGHAYLRGKCMYEDQVVEVTALMADKMEEAALSEGDCPVSAEEYGFTRGAGLLLCGCRLVRGAQHNTTQGIGPTVQSRLPNIVLHHETEIKRRSNMEQTQPGRITPPISTAWFYMSDDQEYNTIPETWSDINFKDVDVLNIGPAGVQSDGTFGLYNSPETGDLANRFTWVIQTARGQNPNIKIIISQWWGDGDGIWGSALDVLSTDAEISAYTDSVIAFLQSYLDVSGGVDGYDIDYEDNNAVKAVPTITSQIRAGMTTLSEANGGRPFYLTASPAETSYLEGAVPSLDFVNMQNYAGGIYLTLEDFTDLGLTAGQLLYGICPETNCGTRTVEEVETEYTDNNLAGIHLWRLNSDNYIHEGEVQAQIYSFLHP